MKRVLFIFTPMLFTATILAQVETKGFYGVSTHESQPVPPPYGGSSPPPLVLSEAYTKALAALGDATNHFYCLSATCLNPLPSISGTVGGFDKGWMFEFANTNGAFKRVHVFFDKGVAWVGNGADYTQCPVTNKLPVGF
jgi:hypothetical protein